MSELVRRVSHIVSETAIKWLPEWMTHDPRYCPPDFPPQHTSVEASRDIEQNRRVGTQALTDVHLDT